MLDNQLTDPLTEAEQALSSILSPAADKAPRSVRKYQLRDFIRCAPNSATLFPEGEKCCSSSRVMYNAGDGAVPAARNDQKAVGDEQLDLRIELGRTHIPSDEARKLRGGSLVRLDKLSGEPVDLYAGGRLIGRGEALVLDGQLGVRVVELTGL